MSSNVTSGDLVLEDINTGEKFTLRRTVPMYHCGRKRTNQILSHSISASRLHCIFLWTGASEHLHVIDMTSANGVYINGVIQQPSLMVELKINDVIGLGCPSMLPETRVGGSLPTVYVLKASEPDASALRKPEDDDMVLTQQARPEAGTSTAENKRKISMESNEITVPRKIPKLEGEANILEDRRSTVACSSALKIVNENSEDTKQAPILDIIEITDESSSEDEMKILANLEKKKRLENPRVVFPGCTSDPEAEFSSSSGDLSKSLLMDDDDDEKCDNVDLTTSNSSRTIEKAVERDKIQSRPSVISIATASATKKKRKESVGQSGRLKKMKESNKEEVDETAGENSLDRTKLNPEITDPVSDNSLSISKKVTVVDSTLKPPEKRSARNPSDDYSFAEDEEAARRLAKPKKNDAAEIEDGSMDFLVEPLNIDEVNSPERTNNEDVKMDDPPGPKLVQSNENGLVQWIKYEPELSIVDEDESLYKAPEDCTELPAPTPLKLKRVKEEKKTRYSELDVVTLSDDEDGDFFPASQLFGDEPEDRVKLEKTELDMEEESEAQFFGDKRNDDPDIILLTDSENEDDPLYNRVMHSSLNENRDYYIKQEEPENQQEDFQENLELDGEPEESETIAKNHKVSEVSTAEIGEAIMKESKNRNKKKKKKLSGSSETSEEPGTKVLGELSTKTMEELGEMMKKKQKILAELEKSMRSKKREDGTTAKKVSRENLGGKREDTSLGSKEKRDSVDGKKVRDGKSSKRDESIGKVDGAEITKEKESSRSARSKKSEKRKSTDEAKAGKSSDAGDRKSEDRRSNDKNTGKSGESTEESGSNSAESSRSIGSSTMPGKKMAPELPFVALTRLDSVRKSVPIVDAPFLTKGERRSVSMKKVEKSADGEELPKANNEELDVPRKETTKESAGKKSLKKIESGPKLTAKEKKELALKAKQEEFLHKKEQRIRRMINKWADCLPPRKHQAPSILKKERDEIKNDRKEKLKKIAEEKKKTLDNNGSAGSKRTVTKAIAKVTEKTRSHLLVSEMEYKTSKLSIESEADLAVDESSVNGARSMTLNDKNPDKPSKSKVDEQTNVYEVLHSSIIKMPSEKTLRDKSLGAITDNLTNGESSLKSCDTSVNGTMKKNDVSSDAENVNPDSEKKKVENSASTMNKVSHRLQTLLLIEPRNHEPLRLKVKAKIKNKNTAVGFSDRNIITQLGLKDSGDPGIKVGQSTETSVDQNSSNKTSSEISISKISKRVTFNPLMNKVQWFEIEAGNSMKKCPTTDAPVLLKKYQKNINRSFCPQLEQFLLRIFAWNPAWLQEQKKLDIPPPIVDEKSLLPLHSSYGTYEDYYKIMEPLLALELWYQITRDLEITEKLSKRSPVMSSIVTDSMSLSTVPSTNIRVTRLILEVVVSDLQLSLHAFPVYGDLVFFEYASKIRGKKSFYTVFGYVENISRASIGPGTRYNRDLLNYVQHPSTLLSYSVVTKPLDHANVETNRVYRLRSISYLRSNMRMIQSLQYLPFSPLLDQILHPDIKDYRWPEAEYNVPYSLVTKDNLNAKQLEAVVRVSEAVVSELPKICLIQGPPGTGKSKVIVNLVTEILYGVRKYSSHRSRKRILVCAPSNAAIDEIVVRLLAIRKTLPESKGRFKMVRIGQTDTMHPLAKSISLNVLAKRDVKTTTENYMSPDFTDDSVETEERLLVAKINSQQLELTSAHRRKAPEVNYLANTLSENKSRLELLMNRRPLDRIEPQQLSKLERAAATSLLLGADVITCTLTSSYTSLMESLFTGSGQQISACIVDEATQCVEVETLIPLMLGVKTLVLVGDTNQLPATIISQKAKKFGLDQSLFARIQKSFAGTENSPVIELDTQYRMSWPVALWPNKFFYGGALKNAAYLRNLPFDYYKVINLDSTQDDDKFSNIDEASFVANLFYTLMVRWESDGTNMPVNVGIITPYNHQKVLIVQKIKERIGPLPVKVKSKMTHEVNTVDSFQGQERDVIIMSCVRSNGIGFLSDRPRLCVALTRAKHSLILCGNFKTFEKDPMWNELLEDAKSRGAYINMKATAKPKDIKPLVIR